MEGLADTELKMPDILTKVYSSKILKLPVAMIFLQKQTLFSSGTSQVSEERPRPWPFLALFTW